MPQMMPINWIISFIFFISIFIMFNILNYYNFNLKINLNNKNLEKKKIFLFWKW
uniref:ATP synthase complex subunit 8 n=1 Tax=Stathmopoda auriferella TaxID=1421331 RepID=A0A343A124_9NEOP|nr:ATP synthase F0 subunit 8 [Stathmopoda auriferella]AOX13380.1 ATP synthase F0 subunit 8 [Stathmopoda auriferella]